MSRKIAEELLPRMRQRYMGRGREGRSRLIDELCEQSNYSRKHAIKRLGDKTCWGSDPAVRASGQLRRRCGGGAVADLEGGRAALRRKARGAAAPVAPALRRRIRKTGERTPKPCSVN
jgi:hypothetical protein